MIPIWLLIIYTCIDLPCLIFYSLILWILINPRFKQQFNSPFFKIAIVIGFIVSGYVLRIPTLSYNAILNVSKIHYRVHGFDYFLIQHS